LGGISMSEFRISNWIARSVVLLVALLFTVPLVSAQVTTGNLQGVVKDPNGAVVAGAAVKITNAATGISKETTTNDEGFYRVTNLLPGPDYTVEVSGTGFQTKTLEKVNVRLGSENVADVSLAVQGVEGANVQVTSEQPLIQTTQSQLSQSFTPQQLTQLPFNGLIDNLALLTPGVVTPGDADFSNGVGISANGNRGRSNNFQIDGQDNNDNSVAGPSLFVSNGEAIGEFQVITNSFSAEFGRNSGAQINTITKSGTNEFHGALFEYHQNSAIDARNNIEEQAFNSYSFLSRNGVTSVNGLLSREGKNVFNNNRFGGAIGGPIKKNKAFFFVTYQGDRTRGEGDVNDLTFASMTPTLASALALRGIPGLSAAAVAAITSTGVGGGPATAQGVGTLIIVPPTIDTNGDGIPDQFQFGPGNVFGQPVTPGFFAPLAVLADATAPGGRRVIFGGESIRIIPTNSFDNQLIAKADFNPTSKDTIVVRYIYDKASNPLATGRFIAGAIFDVPSKNNNLGVTYTRTLSPNWVNEARFNFSRLDVRFGDPDATLPGPGISFSGTRDEFFNLQTAFGTQNNLPQSRKVDVYQYQDTMSATIGNHSMRFGADIRQQKVQNFFLPNFLGTFTFNGSNTSTATAGTLPAGFFRYGTNGLDGASRTGARAWAFENFLLGRPRQINFAVGNPRINTDQDDYFFFFQDDWRIRPNLTLNLGVRYEVSTQPFNPIIQQINAREANAATAIFNTAFPIETRTATEIPTDKNNIAPRVGFAWQPNIKWLGDYFSNGRTVIRGGFGISYDPSFFNIVLNTVTAAPFAAAGIVLQQPGFVGPPAALPFPSLPTTQAQLNATPGTNGGDPRLFNQTRVSPDFHNPYALSYNFGIQQELFKNTVIEARYVGTRITGQFQTINGNPDLRFVARAGCDPTAFPGANTATCGGRFTGGIIAPGATFVNNFDNRPGTTGAGRLDPNFGPTRTRINGASSTYNGMQLRFDTRFWSFLTLDANYTLSKTIDNASEIFGTLGGGQGVAASQNFFDNNDGERGLSAFHQKHNFTTNFILELPWFKEQRGAKGKFLGGYQFASIIRFGSGRPYTPLEVLSRNDVAFEGAFINGVIRPFNGNPNAPVGTIAFGFAAACQVLFGGPECAVAVPNQFIIYNTLNPGSVGTVVSGAQALQQARLIYNDYGLAGTFGLPLASLEAFQLFRSPYGDVGRNTFSGLPFYSVNLSVFKTTNVAENVKLEFRAEAFNILNRRNFGVPDAITEDASNGFVVGSFQNPGFNGGSKRTWRLGLRLIF
jgi:hypothetical protein